MDYFRITNKFDTYKTLGRLAVVFVNRVKVAFDGDENEVIDVLNVGTSSRNRGLICQI